MSSLPPFACRPSSAEQTVTEPPDTRISFSALIPFAEYAVFVELPPLEICTQSPEIVSSETEEIRYPFIAVLIVSPVVDAR